MADGRVRLDAMSDAEYDRFLAESIPAYAESNVAAGRWSAEGAEAQARAEFARLLPEGRATSGHALLTIRALPDGEAVGRIWLWLVPGSPPGGFVYDLAIDPAHRRRGYAEAALRLAEERLRSDGANRIGLHVFANNPGAIRLYEKIGYAVVSQLMSKPIPPAPSGASPSG
ncbi:MAG TPA: GNAT family N-acetyltransferase [Thermoplasmata archaeon]|nr:GNAT family N-acetyltransferase [Thermoplasmata archaeon]